MQAAEVRRRSQAVTVDTKASDRKQAALVECSRVDQNRCELDGASVDSLLELSEVRAGREQREARGAP